MFRADDVIGEYRLLALLGEGALGVVWHAQRIDRPETVALKLIQPARVSAGARRQAYDELTRALTRTGRLEHAHLQSLSGIALRPEDGVFGLAAQHYDGGPFENLGNIGRRETLIKALGLLRQLAEVLSWLHELGLVHGNIKPTNTLVTPGPSGPSIVLTDLCWSLAHLGRRTEKTRIFVSPEQLARQSATAASDQWTAARMLHQLAVRGSPGSSQTEALTSLPLPVLKVLKRALEHDPKARFASMSSFVQALENAEEELGSAGASAPSALPTPTLEVSAIDAIAVRRASEAGRRAAAPEPEDEHEHEHDPNEAPTSATRAPLREAATEPGTLRKVSAPAPAPVQHADPSQESADPTTPISLQAINPSTDRHDTPVPRSGPLLPSDPTDILPAVRPAKKSGPGLALGLTLFVAALVIAGSGFVLWTNHAATEAPLALAAAPPPAKADAPDKVEAPAKVVDRVEAPAEVIDKVEAPAEGVDMAPAPAKVKAPAPTPPSKRAMRAAAPPPAAIEIAAKATVPTIANESPMTRLERGCQAGRRTDCKTLGDAYLSGDGVARDTTQGRVYYGRACDLRLTSACRQAGSLYAATGRDSDAKRARRYFEKACDTGQAAACGELAELWAEGLGGAANPRTAKALANRACKMGHKPSCE